MLSAPQSFVLLASFFGAAYLANYAYLRWREKTNDQDDQERKRTQQRALTLNFMGTVLVVFGLLKLYDLRGFAAIFRKYDLVSGVAPPYAYAYPFVELALGLAFLRRFALDATVYATAGLMALSVASVVVALARGKKLRCGCMGSFLHVPLSYVTLSENILMLLMLGRLRFYL